MDGNRYHLDETVRLRGRLGHKYTGRIVLVTMAPSVYHVRTSAGLGVAADEQAENFDGVKDEKTLILGRVETGSPESSYVDHVTNGYV